MSRFLQLLSSLCGFLHVIQNHPLPFPRHSHAILSRNDTVNASAKEESRHMTYLTNTVAKRYGSIQPDPYNLAVIGVV